MIALLKLIWMFLFLCVALPVIAIAVLSCAIYEALRGMWVMWCWLKEVGK